MNNQNSTTLSFFRVGAAVCLMLTATVVHAEAYQCAQTEIVLSHKHRHTGLTGAETRLVHRLVQVIEQKGNMVRAVDRSSKTRAGTVPGICPDMEKICRNLTRRAKLGGRADFVALHHLSCSYNYTIHQSASSDDYSAAKLTGLAEIGAPAAWNYTTGSDDVVVAILDTGIDYNHPDLAANVWTNDGEVAGNGSDDDGNGYVDDVHGINALTDSGDPMDDFWHGTHLAGTIGAVGNNGVGLVGVNWRVKLLGIKVLGAGGDGSLSYAVKGMNYLLDLKLNHNVPIKVINASWGYQGPAYTPLDVAIKAARDAGMLFVTAAGNSSTNIDTVPFYPAGSTIENVISVAAVDGDGNLATFSNYGERSVQIAAPGVDIFSTYPNGQYATASGTSMAAPHVSGALALLAAANPSLTWQQLRDVMLGNATASPSLKGRIAAARELNLGQAVSQLVLNGPAAVSNPTPAPTIKPTPTARQRARRAAAARRRALQRYRALLAKRRAANARRAALERSHHV